jgi:hypothetical protein
LPLPLLLLYITTAGDLWLLSADDNSTLLDAVMESFRIHDRAVREGGRGEAAADAAAAAAAAAAASSHQAAAGCSTLRDRLAGSKQWLGPGKQPSGSSSKTQLCRQPPAAAAVAAAATTTPEGAVSDIAVLQEF